MILFLNLSSRYLALELSETQEQLLSNKIIQKIYYIYSCICFNKRYLGVNDCYCCIYCSLLVVYLMKIVNIVL